MKGKVVLLFLFIIFCSFSSTAQVYHYATGKIIPSNEPGLFNFKPGVFESYPAEYAVLLAKENRTKLKSKLISLPVIQIKAVKNDSLSYPIFLLYGGPGESNLKSDLIFDSLLLYHDIVLVGYRGVDGGVVLNCPVFQESFENLTSTAITDQINECINEFAIEDIDISGYSMDEVCDDLFEVKQALGYDAISFLAYSYGTIVAQKFCQMHPKSVKNAVLLGPRPYTNLLIDGSVLDKQLQQIMNRSEKNTYYDILNIYKSINQNKIYPSFQFNIFFFSQFYASSKLDAFEMAMYSFSQGKVWYLDKLYRDFYRNYPGKMVVGDMILKKQNSVHYNQITNDSSITTLGSNLAQSVNEWYFPQNNILESKVDESFHVVLSKILFLCGEFDIAAPPELISSLSKIYPNSELIQIDQSCHLDFFFDNKSKVSQMIIDFYTRY